MTISERRFKLGDDISLNVRTINTVLQGEGVIFEDSMGREYIIKPYIHESSEVEE